MECVPNHAKMTSTNTISFKVTRRNPELIHPLKPTPNELKYLSDLDDQYICQSYFPMIHFFQNNPSMEGKDPVNIIRHALARTLVFYYLFAGRLREQDSGKLVVECTGEGVVFVEADADAMLQEFGKVLYPPFPKLEELLHYVPTSNGITNCPLLIIQVTRLKCGGFILAYCFNHIICDGPGILHFISAVGELARGAAAPSVSPVWERHLLSSPHPPHHRSREIGTPIIPIDKMVQRSFLFSDADISALRCSLPPHLRNCTKFEVAAAFSWRCWTIALSLKPNEDVRFTFAADIRKRLNPPLPEGYYGNAVVPSSVVTSAEKLSEFPLEYAVELVRKAKYGATQEYVADVMVKRDGRNFRAARTYAVSDLRRVDLKQVDFGWGRGSYGGVAKGIVDWIPTLPMWYVSFEDGEGKEGIVVPVCLPIHAMDLFVQQLETTIPSFSKSLL